MRDIEAIRRSLAGFLEHGAILRDGVEVGFWHVLGRGGRDRRKVGRLWRAADGRMLGDTVEAGRGDEADVGEGGSGAGFGTGLVRLMECAGLAPVPASRVVDVVTWSATLSEIMRLHPGIDFHEANELADRLPPEGLAEAAGPYAATLDAGAVSLLLRHSRHAGLLGELWRDLDASDGDAPLAVALETHPGFPAEVAAVHCEVGADGMRRVLAEGWLGTLVAGRLVEGGIPRCMVPLSGRAEAALAGLSRNAAEDPGACPRSVRWVLADQGDIPWPVRLSRLLLGLPGAWAPRDAEQWRAFAMAAPVLGVLGRTVDADALPRVLNAGAGWDAFLRRLKAASGADDTDGVLAALEGKEDMVSAYAMGALLPAYALANPERFRDGDANGIDVVDVEILSRRARSLLFGDRTVARVLALSTDWHRRQHGMRIAVAAMPGAYVDVGSWAAGLPDAAHGDIEVAVLRDVPSLLASASDGPDADGSPGLDNCAGAYGPECGEGDTRILELGRRLPDGRVVRLSMVEVDVSDAPRLRVVQHVGRRNGPPPADAARALEAYLGDVAGGRLPVDLDAFVPVPDDGVDAVTRACGFDPAVTETRLAVARLWDRYLPGPWRGLDPVHALALPRPDGDGWGAAPPAPPSGGRAAAVTPGDGEGTASSPGH